MRYITKKYLVTGGAGFIGSNMVERLLEDGSEVTVLDNFSSGKMEFIHPFLDNGRFKLVEGDLLEPGTVLEAMEGVDLVMHLGANPDVRTSHDRTDRDIQQGIMATYNVLEAMRTCHVGDIAFSSTSTIYGEATVLPTPEDYGPLFPISLYASSKLGCEAIISAYCHTFDMRCWLFRFANVIGKNGTHGVLVDFVDKLNADQGELEILGDGRQSKSYLLVEDCVDAMLFAIKNADAKCNAFNIGTRDHISVTRIAELVVEELCLSDVKLKYTGGERGWTGDVPKMLLDVTALEGLGWSADYDSEGAIRSAIRLIKAERWEHG